MAYMRTSRPKTPVIYGPDETFPIGGSKVLRQSANDVAAVVGAGVTVFEALKAYDQLKAEGIDDPRHRRVFGPADRREDDDRGRQRATGGVLITVEDHYPAGGHRRRGQRGGRAGGIRGAPARGARDPAQRPARRAARSLRHLGAAHRRGREARRRAPSDAGVVTENRTDPDGYREVSGLVDRAGKVRPPPPHLKTALGPEDEPIPGL